MNTRKLLVYGAGGHGKVVADIGRAAGWQVVGFIDDEPERVGDSFAGMRVVSLGQLLRERDRLAHAVALGIGDNRARERCVERLRVANVELVTLLHPSAVIAPSARIGAGTVVMALSAVNPDAVVGEGCILNTGSVVEHENRVGRFAHLSPKVALGGRVEIGDRTHLGLGAVVLPSVRVGADVRVGAGAVVHRDVPDGVTVVGVPARQVLP